LGAGVYFFKNIMLLLKLGILFGGLDPTPPPQRQRISGAAR
jgi:hypothetical protein